jgi:hypothetical protein
MTAVAIPGSMSQWHEVGLLVADKWQRRSLGTSLMSHLLASDRPPCQAPHPSSTAIRRGHRPASVAELMGGRRLPLGGRYYSSRQTGLRFSRNAVIPSCASCASAFSVMTSSQCP